MKQVSRNRHPKAEQEQDETQAKEVRDEQLSEETEDLLSEIDCCLAEAVTDQDEKAKAKAEWDAINARFAEDHDYDERYYGRQAWLEKYRDVVKVTTDCCGVITPHFE